MEEIPIWVNEDFKNEIVTITSLYSESLEREGFNCQRVVWTSDRDGCIELDIIVSNTDFCEDGEKESEIFLPLHFKFPKEYPKILPQITSKDSRKATVELLERIKRKCENDLIGDVVVYSVVVFSTVFLKDNLKIFLEEEESSGCSFSLRVEKSSDTKLFEERHKKLDEDNEEDFGDIFEEISHKFHHCTDENWESDVEDETLLKRKSKLGKVFVILPDEELFNLGMCNTSYFFSIIQKNRIFKRLFRHYYPKKYQFLRSLKIKGDEFNYCQLLLKNVTYDKNMKKIEKVWKHNSSKCSETKFRLNVKSVVLKNTFVPEGAISRKEGPIKCSVMTATAHRSSIYVLYRYNNVSITKFSCFLIVKYFFDHYEDPVSQYEFITNEYFVEKSDLVNIEVSKDEQVIFLSCFGKCFGFFFKSKPKKKKLRSTKKVEIMAMDNVFFYNHLYIARYDVNRDNELYYINKDSELCNSSMEVKLNLLKVKTYTRYNGHFSAKNVDCFTVSGNTCYFTDVGEAVVYVVNFRQPRRVYMEIALGRFGYWGFEDTLYHCFVVNDFFIFYQSGGSSGRFCSFLLKSRKYGSPVNLVNINGPSFPLTENFFLSVVLGLKMESGKNSSKILIVGENLEEIKSGSINLPFLKSGRVSYRHFKLICCHDPSTLFIVNFDEIDLFSLKIKELNPLVGKYHEGNKT